MISTCKDDGEWSPIDQECSFDPKKMLENSSLNISKMNLTSMIIIVALSGIILLLLASIFLYFKCRKFKSINTNRSGKKDYVSVVTGTMCTVLS